MMMDLVNGFLEWFMSVLLSGYEEDHKTSSTAEGTPQSRSQIPSRHDLNSPDPIINGLTGAHVLIVGFAVIVVWLVISNLTTRVVEPKRRSHFRESRNSESLDYPLHGFIDDNSDRHIWQENFLPPDLKLKWILERHESDLHHLQKHQIEQDIKFSYFSRKLCRRDRSDSRRRSSARRRPEIFLRESNRYPGKLDLVVTSEDEIESVARSPLSEGRCRCVKMRSGEGDKRDADKIENGDEIAEEANFKDDISYLPNILGQGDVIQDHLITAQQKNANSTEPRGVQEQCQTNRTPTLLHRSRGLPTSDLFMTTNPKILQTIFSGGEKLAAPASKPPTPPPRPELPRRTKLAPDSGVLDSKLVNRFMTRHPETESIDPSASGVSSVKASVNPDASRRETALALESPSPVDSPDPDCAT